MSESHPEKKEESPTPSASPAQAGAESSVPTSEPPSEPPSPSPEEKLEQAKTFLQDDQVQNTSHERKVEFLKSKGLSESDIQSLLKDVAAPAEDGRSETSSTLSTASDDRISLPLVKKEDRPPIVTYPEFLTKPSRPPPLVTVNRFVNTLYAFSGLSALVYGASKYVIEPMVDSLTDARIDLHETANKDLAKLITKLESTVSEIPPPKRPRSAAAAAAGGSDTHENEDAESSYEDPAELFHRDVGVQADLPDPSSPEAQASPQATDKPITKQMRTLFSLVTSLKSLQDGLGRSTEALEDAQVALEGLRDDAEKLSAPAVTDFVGGFSLYGVASKNEPNDEIKKAKENVRRVKGVLLSTRSFPTGR
ncbi:hypothetical protein VTJ83DRAFT_6460 [Remersonia thermophila]|uniref:Peroxisomal membrane protein PEX14 n=1 Tax=Remersonia thermophila TaxID=72144 RepID=A0ABR4D4R3_9PEZI